MNLQLSQNKKFRLLLFCFVFQLQGKKRKMAETRRLEPPGGEAIASQAWLGPSESLTWSRLPAPSCLLPAPDPRVTGCNMASLSGSVSAEVSKPQNGAIGELRRTPP